MLSAVNPSYILGYHGCDRETAEFVLAGKGDLLASANTYDWLGHGIYFWEDKPSPSGRVGGTEDVDAWINN